jgi:hypothetical protein
MVQRLHQSEAVAPRSQVPEALSPLERVFEHWVFMLGKAPGRVALGPQRRRAIERALDLYPEATLLLAVEGCASSAWHAGDNDRRRPFDDLALILRDEEHIERFAEMGQRLRDRLRDRDAQARSVVPIATPDAAAVAEQRERLRQAAARVSGRQHGG